MFLFIKTVNGFRYYYNAFTNTYEGLKDNATILTEKEVECLMMQVSKFVNKKEFSFIKHI